MGNGAQLTYTSTLLSGATLVGYKYWIEVDCSCFFFDKSHLLWFELETSVSDTMLDYYTLTSSPKRLNWLGSVNNLFIFQHKYWEAWIIHLYFNINTPFGAILGFSGLVPIDTLRSSTQREIYNFDHIRSWTSKSCCNVGSSWNLVCVMFMLDSTSCHSNHKILLESRLEGVNRWFLNFNPTST
jgi:hypothetical protein